MKKKEIEQLQKDVESWKKAWELTHKELEELKIRYDEAGKRRCNHNPIPYFYPITYIQQPIACKYCGRTSGCPGHTIC